MIRRTVVWTWVVCLLAGALGCGVLNKSGGRPALKVGKAITVTKPVSITALSNNPETFVGQTVRLEGTVSGVCMGSGCWAEVQAADGSTFMAKSTDHSVLVPTDCLGRKIVVQGVVTAVPVQAQEEEHHHEEGEEPHECPRPTYLVTTQGVELY